MGNELFSDGGLGNEPLPKGERMPGKFIDEAQRIKELEEALRPFAEEASFWSPVDGEHSICFGHDGTFTYFTMADVRKAAQVMGLPLKPEE